MADEVLLVGAGGIGAPAALALAESGLERLCVVDDDVVEITNLHRQVLFEETDVGRPKLDALGEALARRYPGLALELVSARAVPETVASLVDGAAVVLDGTDNLASRFLLADAAHIASVPVVHAAAVRWEATVMACAPDGGPCYRCLFEDVPSGEVASCATAGVAGPVCGVSGAIAADLALRILDGDAGTYGHITTYEGLRDRLRRVPVAPRAECPLCGPEPAISALDANRYMTPECAAR